MSQENNRPEKIKFLDWNEFVKEVRRAAADIDIFNVRQWYIYETKKHKNWPKNPNMQYKDKKEWQSWTELLGTSGNPPKK